MSLNFMPNKMYTAVHFLGAGYQTTDGGGKLDAHWRMDAYPGPIIKEVAVASTEPGELFSLSTDTKKGSRTSS